MTTPRRQAPPTASSDCKLRLLQQPASATAASTEPRCTMAWFTSGIDSTEDAGLAAGAVKYVLGDRISMPHMSIFFTDRQIALDSGAYRNFKSKRKKTPSASNRTPTEQDARQYAALFPDRKFAFRVAYDVIGDADTTMLFWDKIFYGQDYPHGQGFVPVYTWGAPEDHLQQYLEQAPWVHAAHTNLAAIGGLASILRGGHRVKDKADKAKLERRRDEVLVKLLDLCERYPVASTSWGSTTWIRSTAPATWWPAPLPVNGSTAAAFAQHERIPVG